MAKRKRIHTFLDYPGDEWLVNEQVSTDLYISVLQFISDQGLKAKILCPGAGKSKVYLALWNAGYKNLTIADIEDESIEAQQILFKEALECDSPTVRVLKLDFMSETSLSAGDFDIILDKGFMDVFLRQGSSKIVWSECMRVLADEGHYISLSMFHSKWKGCFTKKTWKSCLYASIAVPRFSRTRPTIARFSNPIALFACSRTASLEAPMKIGDTEFSNYYLIKKSALPTDAGDF